MSFAQNRAETRPAMFRNRFLELHGALSHFRVDSPEARLQARIEIGGAPVDVDLTQYPRASGVSRHTADARDLLHALADSPQRSLFKLICVGEEERVMGIHLLGEGADEILQGFAVALKRGITKRDLDDTVAIHPTSAEEVVLMR